MSCLSFLLSYVLCIVCVHLCSVVYRLFAFYQLLWAMGILWVYTSIVSGVIQGSVLGPLLFLLYINDVTDIFSSTCASKLYADDIKLYSVLDNPLDYSDLQSNLNELQQWSDRWQLNISH